jgi:hypothetical protein
MTRFFSCLLNFLLVALISVSSFAQQGSKGGFNFKFIDEVTGVRVLPYEVIVKEPNNRNQQYKIDAGKIAGNGTAFLPLTNGVYDVTVSAVGYKQVATYFEVQDKKINVNFKMEPQSPPAEVSVDYIRSLHKADAMVITGYVVADELGLPLDSVLVYSADKAARTVTDKRGYFKLVLPLPVSDAQVEARNKVLFARQGYTTEVRQRFDMWPNGDAMLKIRLTRGSGVHTVDIVKKREPMRAVINK